MATLSPPYPRPLARQDSAAGLRAALSPLALHTAAALAILCSQILGAVGLAWDIQWHISVGRDTFLTPPHVLLYTAVAVTGLVSLAVVLGDTWRSRTGGDIHDGNAVRLLGLFQAPLGFVVAGFGALVTATAAPLDNYWHELYGIDVALWAPFHTMGSLGGFISTLGMLYAWGSLLVGSRRATRETAGLPLPGWGMLATLMLLVGTASVQARPALVQTPGLHVGGVSVALYPLLLGLFVPWLLVLARVGLGRRAASLWLMALWAAFTSTLLALVPWLVQTGAAAEGLPMRAQGAAFGMALLTGLLMVGLVTVSGLATVLLRSWPPDRLPTRRQVVVAGIALGLAIWLLGVGLIGFTGTQVARAASDGMPITRATATPAAQLLALPLTVVTATASAALGAGLSQVLRRHHR